MVKDILIKVRVSDEQILSIVETDGLDEGPTGKLELIGILENLKQLELDKLKVKATVTKQVPPSVDFEVVDEEEALDAEELLDSINVDDYPDDEDDPIKI